jgi:hypothetical protein
MVENVDKERVINIIKGLGFREQYGTEAQPYPHYFSRTSRIPQASQNAGNPCKYSFLFTDTTLWAMILM